MPCTLCEVEGVKKKNGPMVFGASGSDERPYDTYIARALQAQEDNAGRSADVQQLDIRGHTGYSPLHELPDFNLQTQVPLDPMHNVDLGVTKRLFSLT